MRRLLCGRVDPPEQPRDVSLGLAIGNPAAGGSDDDGQWVLHIVGDRSKDRIPLGPQLPLAVDNEGYLVAVSDFPEIIAPSYPELARDQKRLDKKS